MNIYSLYVKVHKITGLRYLGQTKRDPIKYKGSGIDWTEHLLTHGEDVDTIILLQTTSATERNRTGRYYSTLWKVTTAMDDYGNKIWANRIPDTGGGGSSGPLTDAHKKNLSKAKSGVSNPKLGERLQGAGNHMFGKKRPDITGELHPNKNQEIRDKIRHSHTGKKHSQESKDKRSEKLKGVNNPMHGKTGSLSPRYGKTTEKLTCPHCGIVCGKHNYVKYHGGKCKFISV
jgi:hypothetical protein